MTTTMSKKQATESDAEYRTPVERAWADLCDGKENAEVERVMASIGGWEAWADVPLTMLAFTGAFNGEPEHAARCLARAAVTTKAGER